MINRIAASRLWAAFVSLSRANDESSSCFIIPRPWNNNHAFLVVLAESRFARPVHGMRPKSSNGCSDRMVHVTEKVVVRNTQKLFSTSINKHLDFTGRVKKLTQKSWTSTLRLGSDGASVMTGGDAGVGVKWKKLLDSQKLLDSTMITGLKN
jgi:hypothetical protein